MKTTTKIILISILANILFVVSGSACANAIPMVPQVTANSHRFTGRHLQMSGIHSPLDANNSYVLDLTGGILASCIANFLPGSQIRLTFNETQACLNILNAFVDNHGLMSQIHTLLLQHNDTRILVPDVNKDFTGSNSTMNNLTIGPPMQPLKS